jgi:tetratricopeptide (TPR) repeat protein
MTWGDDRPLRESLKLKVRANSNNVTLLASCCCCLLLLTCATQPVSGDQVYASSAHLQALAAGEKVALKALRLHIDSERSRFEEIARLMEEVQTVHEENGRSGLGPEAITGNPLQAFHLIRRFSTIWRSIATLIANNSSYIQLKDAVSSLGDYLPGDTDLTNSLLSLIRLQRTYGLDIGEMIRGNVAGYKSAPLDQKTVFDIALLCLGNGEPDSALQWLAHVQDYTVGPRTVPQPAILQTLGRAYAQKQNYLTAINYIQEAVELGSSYNHLSAAVLQFLLWICLTINVSSDSTHTFAYS